MPDGAPSVEPILEVEDLETVFATRGGAVHAVNGVSFTVAPGELLGVVGESGSGKSVTMMSLMGLLPSPPARLAGGRITFDGRDVRSMTTAEMRRLRGGEIGFVFQDPMTSLNPVFTVGFQLMEPLREHLNLSRSAARRRAAELLALVGIPAPAARLNDYPHQFSGGMRQRVMIAIALACDPKVLIADEPTTALDVTIQAQIIELIKQLRAGEAGTAPGADVGADATVAAVIGARMGIIWITHDLGVIAGIADRVMVMYAGQVVEYADVGALFADPQHPYTRALLETMPNVEGPRAARLRSIPGQPPSLGARPESCPFAPRCTHAFDRCARENPARRTVGPGHDVACWWDPATGGPRDA